MNNLIDRGLIECKGRLDVPGRPMLYGTTSDFLRCFGLESISKLPTTSEEIAAMFERIREGEAEDKPDEIIEGGEQISLSDDALANAPAVSNEADVSVGEDDLFDAENDPSADDFLTVGE